MALISNGSAMLLKYKLNNVCDPKRVRKPRWGGAQITEQFLYTTICCGCQYEKHLNADSKESATKNVIRIISVLKAYYGNNVYCVCIKRVLDKALAPILSPALPSYETDR